MKAMVLNGICDLNTNKKPLVLTDLAVPEPGANQVSVMLYLLVVVQWSMWKYELVPECLLLPLPMIVFQYLVVRLLAQGLNLYCRKKAAISLI